MRVINKVKKSIIIRSVVKLLVNRVKSLFMFICNKIYGINNERIVFVSFSGKSYSDNPRAISEKLHMLKPDMEIIWLFNEPKHKNNVVPDYVNCIKANTLKALKALATSKFWVDNFNKPLYFYKNNEQVYIQTWHGDRAFKRILYDSTFIGNNYKLFETDSCDVIVTGSTFAEKMYKSAYRFNGDFLKVGSPRNDVLLNESEDRIKIIKNKLGLQANDKIILYAPTLRRKVVKKGLNQEIPEIDLLGVIKKLEKDSLCRWICLTRAHSAVAGLEGVPKKKNFIDVTDYEDMAELLQITDLLITDYSSSATDFILMDKPVILYQGDYEEYIKYDRTFYYDLKETGFLIAYNQSELLECIDKALSENTCIRNRKIRDFYGVYETGIASEKVAKYIIEKINGGNA